ncbi:hypothetical protein DFH06DRAFT_1126260 [Mycena polygramma]|nr:hypothetical protein DFH06DRAFT_1126260 [Mycena polygramma]
MAIRGSSIGDPLTQSAVTKRDRRSRRDEKGGDPPAKRRSARGKRSLKSVIGLMIEPKREGTGSPRGDRSPNYGIEPSVHIQPSMRQLIDTYLENACARRRLKSETSLSLKSPTRLSRESSEFDRNCYPLEFDDFFFGVQRFSQWDSPNRQNVGIQWVEGTWRGWCIAQSSRASPILVISDFLNKASLEFKVLLFAHSGPYHWNPKTAERKWDFRTLGPFLDDNRPDFMSVMPAKTHKYVYEFTRILTGFSEPPDQFDNGPGDA